MTDAGTTKAALGLAIEAYRNWERAQLTADVAYKNLNKSVLFAAVASSPDALRIYAEETEKIREEFAKKREASGL